MGALARPLCRDLDGSGDRRLLRERPYVRRGAAPDRGHLAGRRGSRLAAGAARSLRVGPASEGSAQGDDRRPSARQAIRGRRGAAHGHGDRRRVGAARVVRRRGPHRRAPGRRALRLLCPPRVLSAGEDRRSAPGGRRAPQRPAARRGGAVRSRSHLRGERRAGVCGRAGRFLPPQHGAGARQPHADPHGGAGRRDGRGASQCCNGRNA